MMLTLRPYAAFCRYRQYKEQQYEYRSLTIYCDHFEIMLFVFDRSSYSDSGTSLETLLC